MNYGEFRHDSSLLLNNNAKIQKILTNFTENFTF